MDPLLADLKSRSVGLSIHGLFCALAQADDICTAATNVTDTSDQVTAKKKGLQLCAEKCGNVITRKNEWAPTTMYLWLDYLLKTRSSILECGGVLIPPVRYQWKNKSAKHVLHFAQRELGTFYGWLNPLSSRSIIESCVMPVLMNLGVSIPP